MVTLRHPPPVRQRVAPALAGLIAFVAISATAGEAFFSQTWIGIAIGMTISATFVEPYFTRPQDGIANAGTGLVAALAADRSPLAGLWMAAFGFLGSVLALSLLAATLASDASRLKWIAARCAAAFGRAVVVGTLLLALILLTETAEGTNHIERAAAAMMILTASLAINWAGIVRRTRGRDAEFGIALAAIGPRMLLATGAGAELREGARVTVTAARRSSDGSVVLRLPHRDGVRYQIALDEDAFSVVPSFPSDVVIESCQAGDQVIGVAGAGSTESAVEFEPFAPVEIGQPISLQAGLRDLLYQISALRLVKSEWAGASSIVPHAVASQIGWPEDGVLRSEPHLPSPHARISAPQAIGSELPVGYYRVGLAKGTQIQIGIRFTGEANEHLAVLGMSGTGKTAVAHRVAEHLGGTRVVVALDETGEYRTRLGVPVWTVGDFATAGLSVYEPAGDPPTKAKEFVDQCMTAANAEYAAGNVPSARVILLEEAHGWIPEWQVALRHQQEAVAYTTRLIMQARKFGLTFIVVSQRTAVVSKSALSQCENYIILRSIDETSLGYLETVVGARMRDAIGGLKKYEAVCVGPSFNTEQPVIVTLDAPN